MNMKFGSMVWVVLAAVATMGAPSANASFAELATMLKSPVGRFIMLGTEEGAALGVHLLGSKLASARELDLLIAKLGTGEMGATASELEGRIIRIRTRFTLLSAVTDESASGLISKLAREELGAKLGDKGMIQFVESNTAATFAKERDLFIAGKPQGKFAGDIRPNKVYGENSDLAGVDFRFADLRNSTAPFVHMNASTLEGADLSGVKMLGGDLSDSNLRGAVLRRARLKDANFQGSDLVGADLREAQISGANFSEADLRGANLSTANVQDGFFRPGMSTRFDGALYDSNTQLPFSKEVAESLGMIFIGI